MRFDCDYFKCEAARSERVDFRGYVVVWAKTSSGETTVVHLVVLIMSNLKFNVPSPNVFPVCVVSCSDAVSMFGL